MRNVLATLSLGLFSFSTWSQTAPNGQLSPGFSACEPPIRLQEFYGISPQWKIIRVHVNGSYMVLVGQYIGPKSTPSEPDYFPVWVQELGPDNTLTPSDFQIDVTTKYIATFPYAPNVTISKSGLLAFIAQDPTTDGRQFPNPSTTGPLMLPVPRDEVLFTCFYLDCLTTVREVRRFMPIYHLTYTSPPNSNMQLDGMITGIHWESLPGGSFASEYLVYSYIQHFNGLVQAPPWLPQPPSPMPPVRTAHTAIEKVDPWTGAVIPVAHSTPTSTTDSSSYVLTRSAQTFLPSMNWPKYIAYFNHATVGVQAGTYSADAFELEEDPGFGSTSTLWGQLTPIPSWEDGPASYLWAGHWKAGPHLSVAGEAHSNSNGFESIIVRTNLETLPNTSSEKDLVFMSSLNGYAGPEIPITPVNDHRDIDGVFAMEHPAAPLTPGLGTLTVAVQTLPKNFPIQRRTQIYRYQPSLTPGQIGTFAPYKEVHVGAANQVFYLYGATTEHVWGTHDDYSLPGYRVRDMALVRCP